MTTRQGAISTLMSIDPNGTWSDEDCVAEGVEPLTSEEALEMIKILEGEK
jgi:hypothetical protein